MLIPSERCFYECIKAGIPVKFHRDFDCKKFALPENIKTWTVK